MVFFLGETRSHQPNKHQRLLAGFLFRTLINAILRPDTFDIVEKPYIPFPKLKENLFLITRVLENLISGVVFTKQYSVLSFTNAFIQGSIGGKKKRKYKRRNSRISDFLFFFWKLFFDREITALGRCFKDFCYDSSDGAKCQNCHRDNFDKLLCRQRIRNSKILPKQRFVAKYFVLPWQNFFFCII